MTDRHAGRWWPRRRAPAPVPMAVIARTGEGNLVAAIVPVDRAAQLDARRLIEQAGWEYVTTSLALPPDLLRQMAGARSRR